MSVWREMEYCFDVYRAHIETNSGKCQKFRLSFRNTVTTGVSVVSMFLYFKKRVNNVCFEHILECPTPIT